MEQTEVEHIFLCCRIPASGVRITVIALLLGIAVICLVRKLFYLCNNEMKKRFKIEEIFKLERNVRSLELVIKTSFIIYFLLLFNFIWINE